MHDEETSGVGSEISDGHIITVDSKRFRCAAVLLQQYFIHKYASGFLEISLQTP